MRKLILTTISMALVAITTSVANAETYKEIVGNVQVGPVQQAAQIEVPFIVWGGEAALFHANGNSLTTKPGSIFASMGLNLKLVPGDDMPTQVKNFMTGKSPLLRATFDMGGLPSELLNADPRTKPVVLFQLTKSLGDHIVAREHVKTLDDLPGTTGVVQLAGPHEGLVGVALSDAEASWDDVEIIWAKNLTGDESPAAILRANPDADWCTVITPDMIGLTGGLGEVGNGVEGTLKGAHVLLSTNDRPESIKDVFIGRKDWVDANPDVVEKLAAGYLKGCEEVLALQKKYDAGGSPEYMALLQFMQDTWTADVIPTLEDDAHGLILDCDYVLHPGNVAFFGNENPYQGFDAANQQAMALSVARGYASVEAAMLPSPIDWNAQIFKDNLQVLKASSAPRFDAPQALQYVESLGAGDLMEDNTIHTVVINFGENQTSFSPEHYAVEFKKVIELSQQYTNSVVAIRGHADPKFFLMSVVYCGMQKGVIQRTGSQGNYKYFVNGQPLNIASAKDIGALVQSGRLDGVNHSKLGTLNPSQMYSGAKTLARQRSENVRTAVVLFAQKNMPQLKLDLSQIQPIGVGFDEPVNPVPRTEAEQLENMRVEFSLIRTTSEVLNAESSFDFEL